MLSAKTIEIVKSTVPLLQEKGVDITTRFYQIMFSEHPELLNVFNHANQKQGKQQHALANTVYAAAMYIDNLEAIIPVVKQIAHKHRSLGIKAEQYPIVGKCLLQAIKEVVDAPEEVLTAWGEAYGVIADAFISIEAEMYEEAAGKEGGWKDFRNFIVAKKEKESDVITSFYLKPEDGGEVSSFLPGQYIGLKINIPGEKNIHNRQYSLSDASGKGYYRISVKRETSKEAPDGIVSNYLHDHVQEGDVLSLSAPAGDFVLNTDSNLPVVLISGGVGITPMMSMLNTLIEQSSNRDVYFIHAALNSNVHAMKEHVRQVVEENKQVKAYTCYSAPTEQDLQTKNFDKEGFVDLEWLQSIIPGAEAEFYFCGPVPFMKGINAALVEWGVAPEHINFEFFGPKASL
ncbi:NO-inducible flavohemoprotein [Bacillus sp. DX1.1]|uniref:NO-inducible flavohemoprotein n=1 Tax=unclassified Bacillus (in: firmicutes) TaxID=185979 RepID=UPI00256FD7CA|nr:MULTISPECIES: NO-inducible flavohemoprotein [unclassified Bacillus (in: firmicutes)]MDM5154073.1 NO-inducible flavohemoprotein [Bacillus sp. DX1.1]WJE83002.1 NO-inducible flavohemoprotein [Bacillus sp. DX3.1]